MKLSTTKQNLYFYLGIIIIIAFWIISSLVVDNPLVIPKFSETFTALTRILSTGESYQVILMTVLRIVLSTVSSFIVALILALLSYFFTRFRYLIKPLIAFLRSTPVAALIIIFLMMLGNNLAPYIITAFVVIPLLYEGLLISFLRIDKGIVEEVKMLSGINLYVLTKIYLPVTMPYILSTLLSGIGLGIKVMIMAEFIAQPPFSIGGQMLLEKQALEMSGVFAWTIILLVLVFVLEILIKKMQSKANEI